MLAKGGWRGEAPGVVQKWEVGHGVNHGGVLPTASGANGGKHPGLIAEMASFVPGLDEQSVSCSMEETFG